MGPAMDDKCTPESGKFKALVRIGNKIEELLCSRDNGHILVHLEGKEMTLLCMVLGTYGPTGVKERLIREDPDLAKTGDNEWTCCGCWQKTFSILEEPAQIRQITRAWMEHKVVCKEIQDSLRREMQISDGVSQDNPPREEPDSIMVTRTRKDEDEETLDEVEDSAPAGEVEESAQSRESAKRQARYAELKRSAFAGETETTRVWCTACYRWIGLTAGTYSPVNWRSHVAGHLNRLDDERQVGRRSDATAVATPHVRRKSSRVTAVRSLGPGSDGQRATSRVAANSSGRRRARVPLNGGSSSTQDAYPYPHESASSSSTAGGNGSNGTLPAGGRGRGDLQVRFVGGGADSEHPKMAFEVPLGVTHMEIALDFAVA